MDLGEALDKAQRVLLEEQSNPTLRYKYRSEGDANRGVSNESLINLAAHVKLSSERTEQPRVVHEDPKEYKFESVNFDLLLRIFNQVVAGDRPTFIAGILKFVESAFPSQRASTSSFATVNYESSMLPLILEFCVRTGYLKELLGATKKPKFPVPSLAMMLLQLEEMIALNFNLFSDAELQLIPVELRTLYEIAERQTYSARGPSKGPTKENPYYKHGYARMGNEIVSIINGVTEECRKARYFYLKGALQELSNFEIESDRIKVIGFLGSLGFDPLLAASLARAEQQYTSAAGPFDWKDCLGNIRSFYEHLNIDAGQAIAKSAGLTCVDKWDPTLTFFRSRSFFTEQQEKFARGLYTILSDEGVHPLIAEKEFARLLRNMVIEYGLMFLTMLEKKGIKI